MIPQDLIACPMCGASIAGSIRNCAACGEELKAEARRRPRFSRRSRWFFAAGAAFGWIVAAVGEQAFISIGTCVLAAIGGIIGLLVGTWFPAAGRRRIHRDFRPAPIADSVALPKYVSNFAPPDDFFAAKRRRLIWMLGLSMTTGIAVQLSVRFGLEKIIPFGGGIGMQLLALSWCDIDARERGYPISRRLRRVILWFGIVGLSVYFIRTRGIRGILNIVLTFLLLVILTGVQLVAILITYSVMSNRAP